MHIAEKYIKDVLSNKIIVGNLVRLAIERHVRDLEYGHERGLFFDAAAAQRVIDFIHLCNFYKGEWARTAIVLEPHQQFYFWCVYGWKKKNLKGQFVRRFSRTYKRVARKNGKTTEKAGESLAHLFLDNENGAQCYWAATKEDQAKIGFNDCVGIVKSTPLIYERLQCLQKSIYYPTLLGAIKPLGSDSNTQDGFDPSMGMIDEFHAHKTDDMLNILESGMGARLQPLINIITTAGFNKNNACYKYEQNAIDVLTGRKEDDNLFVLIFSLDEEDDWEDQSVWPKANPNLGVSVDKGGLINQFIDAKNQGGTKEVSFKTKNLNIWCDADSVWIQDSTWNERKGEFPDLTGVPCYGGIDLASNKDINAFSLVWYYEGKIYTKSFYWVPEDTMQERVKSGFDYLNWVRGGHITLTEGNVTDYGFIENDIVKIRDQYNIQMVHHDRWNSSQLVISMMDKGFEMVPFGQGFQSMSSPTKELERIVCNGELIHDGNPVTRWMLSNVSISMNPAGDIKADKQKSKNKIDGIVSTVMALGALIPNKGKEHSNEIEVW